MSHLVSIKPQFEINSKCGTIESDRNNRTCFFFLLYLDFLICCHEVTFMVDFN